MAVNDIIKYIGDFGQLLSVNKRIGIYSLSAKIQFQEIKKMKDAIYVDTCKLYSQLSHIDFRERSICETP